MQASSIILSGNLLHYYFFTGRGQILMDSPLPLHLAVNVTVGPLTCSARDVSSVTPGSGPVAPRATKDAGLEAGARHTLPGGASQPFS